MTRLMSWIVGALMVMASVAGGVLLDAPDASACDIAESFVVKADHFASGDMRDPDGLLAQDYRDFARDDAAEIEVLGVYVYETIHAVDPDGDWSRGSVSVLTEVWGEWPENDRPRVIDPENRSGEPPTSCGWGPTGLPVGTRTYTAITTADFTDTNLDDASDSTLTAVFGAPTIAERDFSLEQELIAQLETPSGSSVPLFIGIGLAAVGGAGVVMYMAGRGPKVSEPGEGSSAHADSSS